MKGVAFSMMLLAAVFVVVPLNLHAQKKAGDINSNRVYLMARRAKRSRVHVER
jgi:hypothetical protein